MSQIYQVPMTLSCKQMQIDKETGMMYSNHVSGFTLAKKKKFLEIAPKYWPDITLVCQFIGIVKGTYKVHYMYDKAFRDRIDAITESVTDKIEASMAQYATEKGNFMDRIAWLRAHRGEKYNEKKMVQVDVNISKEQLSAKKASLTQAIDAEIIPVESQVIAETVMQEIPTKSN